MSKKITMDQDQLDRYIAQRIAEGQRTVNAVVTVDAPKPPRPLTFGTFEGVPKGVKRSNPSDAGTFARALVTGSDVALYAYGAGRHGTSLAMFRKLLSDPVIAAAARAFLSALK